MLKVQARRDPDTGLTVVEDYHGDVYYFNATSDDHALECMIDVFGSPFGFQW